MGNSGDSVEKKYPEFERRSSHTLHEQVKIFHALLLIFVLLIGQTGGATWWASKITEKVSALEQKTLDRYKDDDAKRDFSLRDMRIDRNEKDIRELVTLLKEMNEKIDRLLAR